MSASSIPLNFVAANTRLSRRLARRLRLEDDKPFWQRFERLAATELRRLAPGSAVLDLGGGRRCVYAGALEDGPDLRLIAVDISADELAMNRDVAETCVADVAQELPFPDESVDLVLSRALLEHIDGVPNAVRNIARVLRPGARTLHLVPCRYSLFGTAARVLPFGPLLRLVHGFMPHTRGQVEFPVVYDHGHPAAMKRVFKHAGFRQVRVEVCWAQPGYFEWFTPLFMLTSLYEYVMRLLRVRRLAAYMIVIAER